MHPIYYSKPIITTCSADDKSKDFSYQVDHNTLKTFHRYSIAIYMHLPYYGAAAVYATRLSGSRRTKIRS